VREQLARVTGGDVRLRSMDDLLSHGSVSQYVPSAPTPNPPNAIPAFSQPPQQQTMHSGVPAQYSHPGTTDSSNKLLWIALAVVALMILLFGGCAMMIAFAGV
jgi:hypothetical protein